MGKRTARLVWRGTRAVIDIVWKTAAVYGVVLGLTTGTIGLVNEFDAAPENPLRAVIELPQQFSNWLQITQDAAVKYLQED